MPMFFENSLYMLVSIQNKVTKLSVTEVNCMSVPMIFFIIITLNMYTEYFFFFLVIDICFA